MKIRPTAREAAPTAREATRMAPSDIVRGHSHSIRHRAEVCSSARCGCFYCCDTFPTTAITAWVDLEGGEGQTALCPRCGIDSVLGERSGYELSPEFLQQMKKYWF